MAPSVKTALTGAGSPVHHARFAAACKYSNDDVLRFFFTDIQKLTPRKAVDLEKIGRNVLASLLDPKTPRICSGCRFCVTMPRGRQWTPPGQTFPHLITRTGSTSPRHGHPPLLR
jgi:hypothetical protein